MREVSPGSGGGDLPLRGRLGIGRRSAAGGRRQAPRGRRQRQDLRAARRELAELRVRLLLRLRVLGRGRSEDHPPDCRQRAQDRELAHQHRAGAAQRGVLAGGGRPAGVRRRGRLPRGGAELGHAAASRRSRGDPRPALVGAAGCRRRGPARDAGLPVARVLDVGGDHVQGRSRGDLRPLQRALLALRRQRHARVRPELGLLARRRLHAAGRQRRRAGQRRHLPGHRDEGAGRGRALGGRHPADHARRARLRERPRRVAPAPARGRPARGELPQLQGAGVQHDGVLEPDDRAGRRAGAGGDRRVRRDRLQELAREQLHALGGQARHRLPRVGVVGAAQEGLQGAVGARRPKRHAEGPQRHGAQEPPRGARRAADLAERIGAAVARRRDRGPGALQQGMPRAGGRHARASAARASGCARRALAAGPAHPHDRGANPGQRRARPRRRR